MMSSVALAVEELGRHSDNFRRLVGQNPGKVSGYFLPSVLYRDSYDLPVVGSSLTGRCGVDHATRVHGYGSVNLLEM